MKSGIEESNIDNDVSSPVLFTQCQWSSRKRKHSDDELELLNGNYESSHIQATPESNVLHQSQCLIQGEHGICTSQRDGAELPFTDVSKSCESSINRSVPRKSHWFFDTPSENNGSPFMRRHKGVSRRSLESLIDPDFSVSWMESMATPPSDERVAQVSVLSDHEEENASPEIATSNRAQVEPEMKTQTKRSVARVLFNQENIVHLANDLIDAKDSLLFIENDGVAVIDDQDDCSYKTELAGASAFASDNEERYTLSPCVVEAKMDKLREENEEGGRDTENVCIGSKMEPLVKMNDLLTTDECSSLIRKIENQVPSSPPVVCSRVKENLCATSDSMRCNSSKDRDTTKLMESNVYRKGEHDLKRRSKRRKRKENMCRDDGESSRPMASHFMNEYKDEKYQLLDIVDIQSRSISNQEQNLESMERDGKAATEICSKVDKEVSLPCSRADLVAPCLNSETISQSMLKTVCAYQENESSQQLGSSIPCKVMPQSTDTMLEEVMFSPVKVDIDGHSFACLPKKGNDVLDTSDHGPQSPTVVGTSKIDIVKGGKGSSEHFNRIIESTPKRTDSELEQCRFDFSSVAPELESRTVPSPIPKDILLAVEYVETNTADCLKRNDDLQGVPPVETVCQDPAKILQRKSKRIKNRMEHSDGNGWIRSDIIEEILHRAFGRLGQVESVKSFDEKGKETIRVGTTISPANVIPKTPEGQRRMKSSKFKNRKSINGAKLKRRLSVWQSTALALKKSDVSFNLSSANVAEQQSECMPDSGLLESVSQYDGKANDLAVHGCKEEDFAVNILHSKSSECGSKNDSANLSRNLFSGGERNFQDASKGSKQFSEIHGKGIKFADARYRDINNFSSEIGTTTGSEQSDREARKDLMDRTASQSLHIVGEQDSVANVLGSKDLMADKLNRKEYEDFSHNLDMQYQAQVPSQDLKKLVGLEQEENGNSACQINARSNKAKEIPQVDQRFDTNLSQCIKIGSVKDKNKIVGPEVPDISMDVLDDLMFGRSTLEASLLANVLTEEPDSLADCYTSSQTPEQALLINSQVDDTKRTQSFSEFINMGSPRKMKKDRDWKEEKLCCSQVITVENRDISKCRTKRETSPEKCRTSPRIEGRHRSVVGASTERFEEDRRNAEVIDYQIGSSRICCDSGFDAVLKSGLLEENNANKTNASSQQLVRENVKDIIISENCNDMDGITVSISDSLLSLNSSISETKNDNSADRTSKGKSISNQDGKSQACQNEKAFIEELNLETEGRKEQLLTLDESNDLGLSHLLNSTLDLDESIQLHDERISSAELQNLISQEPLEFTEDGKLTQDASLSNSQACRLNSRECTWSLNKKRSKTITINSNAECSRPLYSNSQGHNAGTICPKGEVNWHPIELSNSKTSEVPIVEYLRQTNKVGTLVQRNDGQPVDGSEVQPCNRVDDVDPTGSLVSERPMIREQTTPTSAESVSWSNLTYSEMTFKCMNRISETPTFAGFSTASGKKVDMSEKALDAARKKLETIDENVVSTDKINNFSGFSTASGRKVEISEKALDAARKRLETIDENVVSTEKTSNFSGFSTASGRKVDLSEKALDAARKRLETIDENVVGTEKAGNFSGFSTVSGRKVDISEKALDAARKKLETIDENVVSTEKTSNFSGFSTASGRKVDISEKALDAARKKLETIDENVVSTEKTSNFSGFSTASGRKVDISEKALDAARKKLETIDENVVSTEITSNFSGFSTASGRKVEISEKALDAARKRLETIDENVVSTEKTSKFSGFSTASGRKVDISEKALDAARKRLESIDENVVSTEKTSKFSGFSTASGRKVDISEKALDAARKKLETIDENVVSTEKTSNFSGFSTASGRKVDISEKALDAARKKLETIDENVVSTEKTSNFSGFSTASGRKVDISEKALDAARKKLETIDENVVSTEKASNFSGFSTASGRKVDISEKALDAARKKLEVINENMKKTEDINLSSVDNSFSVDIWSGSVCCKTEGEILPECNRKFSSDNCLAMAVSDNVSKEADQICTHLFNQSMDVGDELFTLASYGLDEKAEEDIRVLRLDDGRLHQQDIRNGSEKCSESKWKCDAESGDGLPRLGLNQVGTTVSIGKEDLGTGRKSSSFLKGKSCNPSEYYNDREVKHTIPLIPRLSQIQDFKSPSTQRPGLTPMSDPTFPQTGSNTAPSSYLSKSEMRITGAKSFSTPYRLKKFNEKEADTQILKGGQLKRPLLASVPFGKRLRLGNEEQQLAVDRVRPQLGRLYRLKNLKKRPRLFQLTDGQQPACCSKKELQDYGLEEAVISVCSENAEKFFFGRESFSDYALRKGETVVGDGAKLLLSKKGCAGLSEFQTAFISLPGVDKSLISDSWFANQYRWVVWKLASVERSFPSLFAGRCLTPHEVMYHLKYRYDKEIDRAERSAIKKILERDDISTSRLVLCISRIFSSEQPPKRNDCTGDDARQIDLHSKVVIEMTDGWYPIKTILDRPLSSLIQCRKLLLGQKLCIYGAKLIGSDQAVSPLEAPESLMLELSANSTRRAHWDAKLGFQCNRRAFPVPIYSLFHDGGLVGCIDVVICRIYPQQWMEKSGAGCVFRNAAQEQRASRKYDDEKHRKMETIYQKIKQKYESSGVAGRCKSKRRSNLLTAKEISEVMNGRELNDILESAHDPGSIELIFSNHQRHMLAEFRCQKEEEQRLLMQKKFDSAWKEVQESFPERMVFPLQKFKVADINCFSGSKGADAYLTVWKPTEDMITSWKEGRRVRIYNLKASSSRYKHCTLGIQLATMNSTRFELKSADDHMPSNVYQPREVTTISALKQLDKNVVKEADVTGYIILIDDQGSHGELQTVYMDDASGIFLAVRVWGGLKAFYLEEIVRPGKVICFKNLLIKKDSFSCDLVTATYNDLSVAFSNPKELYFQEAAKCLQNQIEDVPSYMNDRTEVLYNKILYGKNVSKTAIQKSCDLIPPVSSSISSTLSSTTFISSTVRPNGKNYPVISENERTPSVSNSSLGEHLLPNPLELNDDTELEQKRNKQLSLNRRKRQALARYGEPSDLSPLTATVTPKTRRGFKPPSKRKAT